MNWQKNTNCQTWYACRQNSQERITPGSAAFAAGHGGSLAFTTGGREKYGVFNDAATVGRRNGQIHRDFRADPVVFAAAGTFDLFWENVTQ